MLRINKSKIRSVIYIRPCVKFCSTEGTSSQKPIGETSEAAPSPLLNVIFEKMIKERKSPCFEVFSSQIEIISTPEDYYLALHKLMLESQFRINMSALYIGTGKLERFLLDRLNSKILLNKHIKCNIILDYMRGTRPDKQGVSSMSMLSDIYMKNINHKFLRFGLFNHPNQVNKWGQGIQTSVKEVFGVHHIKAHVFDNNVIITGANLESPHVANYFDDLLDTLTNCSFQITHESVAEMQKHYPDPLRKPEKFKETLSHLLKLMRFANKTNIPVGTQLTCNDFFYGKQDTSRPLLSCYGRGDKSATYGTTQKDLNPQPDPSGNTAEPQEEQKEKADEKESKKNIFDNPMSVEEQEDIIKEKYGESDILIQKYRRLTFQSEDKKKDQKSEINYIGGRVFLFPSLQMDIINIREDENLFIDVLKSTTQNKDLKMDLCSGYLNLMPSYVKEIAKTKSEINILTASPKANGFYKASFFK